MKVLVLCASLVEELVTEVMRVLTPLKLQPLNVKWMIQMAILPPRLDQNPQRPTLVMLTMGLGLLQLGRKLEANVTRPFQRAQIIPLSNTRESRDWMALLEFMLKTLNGQHGRALVGHRKIKESQAQVLSSI